MLLYCLLAAGASLGGATQSHAGNFPFPQAAAYAYGTSPDHRSQSDLNQDVQTAFELWKQEYLTASGAPAGAKRIRRGSGEQYDTVSEGIAYGMLILAYMDNDANRTQSDFDALWRYRQAYVNSHGLMFWKIDASGNVLGSGSATDADVDMAFALLVAHVQWGSAGSIQYFQEAKTLLDRILTYDIMVNTMLLKPGDAWTSTTVTNPSYFCPAYLSVFAAVSADDGWNQVLAAEYQLVDYFQQHYITGLLPDWCRSNGLQDAADTYRFTYDACRVPWRIGWDYLWYGTGHHILARDQPQRAAAWMQTTTGGNPNSIWDGYQLDGVQTGAYNHAAFVGGFGVAAMTDPALQAWCNTLYDHLRGMPAGGAYGYYPDTLRVLYLLLLTRNMPNLCAHLGPDMLPPALQAIEVRNVTERSANVAWTSDEAADSRIDYGLTPEYGQQKTDPAMVVQHSLALAGLTPGALYHYKLTSKDAAGNLASTGNLNFYLLSSEDQSRTDKAREKLLSPALQDGVNDAAFFGPEAEEVWIVNVSGREVFHQTQLGIPGAAILWNGRDQQGGFVPAGVYIARIRNRTGAILFQKFVVAR